MHIRSWTVTIAAAVWLLGATPAAGGGVTVNGVDVTGLKSHEFKGCSVRFDENGDIHITAPGYVIQQVEASRPPVTAPELPRAIEWRVFAVSDPPRGCRTGYRLEVSINGTEWRAFGDHQERLIEEVSARLRPGDNRVRIRAAREPEFDPAGAPAACRLRLMLGRGRADGPNVVIEEKLIEYQREAADEGNHDDELTFSVR